MIFENPWNWVAFGLFLALWIGYTLYAKKAAKSRECISALLYGYRVDWVRNMVRRENRIPDAALQGNLSHLVSFLASTTIFVIAGGITVIYSTDSLVALLSNFSFVAATNKEEIQFKLIILVLIFVFAFFKFTWSMRQHSFFSIMMGALPHVGAGPLTPQQLEFTLMAAKISDRAGHEFNYGLRSYYFALAVLTWFISPWAFMPACIAVVTILYLREFNSKTLSFLVRSRNNLPPRED